jgi:hypothetical protein
MADDGPDNLVLRYLREIDRKLDNLIERLDYPTNRTAAVETVMGFTVTSNATLNARLDSVDRRLERIERRLDLVEVT